MNVEDGQVEDCTVNLPVSYLVLLVRLMFEYLCKH